jgi:glutathione S-transferase
MYVFSGVLSVFSAKVRIAIREKAIAVEIREVPWTRATAWGDKPAELLAANPRGQVPTLIDGDLAVFDSTIINEYLDERFPERPLLPADPQSRARCRLWEALGDDLLTAQLPVLVRETFMKPDGQGRDQDALAGARSAADAHFRRLNQALDGADYLCGDYSLADIGNFLAVAFCRTLGTPPADELHQLAAWFDRVYRRPAVKAEFDAITAAAAAA